MGTLAVQYLENSLAVATISPHDAQMRLRSAMEQLPISLVLLGWNLPDALVMACAEECERRGAQLYRWQPLLTGDGTFIPRPEWHTIGLSGDPIPGFQGMPEFTFVCPNRPAVREAVLSHVRDVLQDPRYRGIFLDRIRYPSPAADPERALGCFCDDCHHAAATVGLDLEAVRRSLQRLVGTAAGATQYVSTLLDPYSGPSPTLDLEALVAFLEFRAQSVSRFIQDVARLIHEMGRAVGLDGFSPALTHMVGQDLSVLTKHSDWVKIMSYGHTLGPAGIPFELLGFAGWLIDRRGMDESAALALLSRATRLPLPPDRSGLRRQGLSPEALKRETQRARTAGVSSLLAGIELVEIAGVAELNSTQIATDLAAFHAAGADGLVLSWDLWEIPLERLALVRAAWIKS